MAISNLQARAICLNAQGLSQKKYFGGGPSATLKTIQRLGYVQIDTIYVIERAHHHILWTRVPDYHTDYLKKLHENDKSVFEYWTHALSYIPVENFRHYIRRMNQFKKPKGWFASVKPKDAQALLDRISREGPLSIQEIDEEKKNKDHLWASRKPSKRVLEYLFFTGQLAIANRQGMKKRYEILERHFSWKTKPEASTLREEIEYRLNRALDSQGLISLESATFLETTERKEMHTLIDEKIKKKELLPVTVEFSSKLYFVKPAALEVKTKTKGKHVWLLSPFDPLIIQRKRLKDLFQFDYTLECYVPAPKRIFGYFVTPILIDEQFVARLDLKANRVSKKLEIKAWHWENKRFKNKVIQSLIESELERYELFCCN